MDTMQKAQEQAIADNVEGVLFHINDGMTKDQAMATQRKSSCMGDKIWEQIGKAVDAANEPVAEITVKPLVQDSTDNKDYGVLMLMDGGEDNMSGVLSPRASGVDNADSDLPSREEYQRTLARHADVVIERDELRKQIDHVVQDRNTWKSVSKHACDERDALRAKAAELEAQATRKRGQWCNPVVTE